MTHKLLPTNKTNVTDLNQVITALHEALVDFDRFPSVVENDDAARSVIEKSREILTALDAARSQAVATQYLLANPLDGSEFWVTCPPNERPPNVSPKAKSRNLYTTPPVAAVSADVTHHASVAVSYLDHGGGMPSGLSLALQRLRAAMLATTKKESTND